VYGHTEGLSRAAILAVEDPAVDEVQVHRVVPAAAAGDDAPHLQAPELGRRFDAPEGQGRMDIAGGCRGRTDTAGPRRWISGSTDS
jgi:hypothetical protein